MCLGKRHRRDRQDDVQVIVSLGLQQFNGLLQIAIRFFERQNVHFETFRLEP